MARLRQTQDRTLTIPSAAAPGNVPPRRGTLRSGNGVVGRNAFRTGGAIADKGQHDFESRAAMGQIARDDAAAMRHHDLATDRQAEAGTASARARLAALHELVENRLEFLRGNADAFILDAKPDLPGPLAAGTERLPCQAHALA